jgi:hypothetical protein
MGSIQLVPFFMLFNVCCICFTMMSMNHYSISSYTRHEMFVKQMVTYLFPKTQYNFVKIETCFHILQLYAFILEE